jgi:Zn-dependent peptidase ImmA (M78 family)
MSSKARLIQMPKIQANEIPDEMMKARIVHMILTKKTEEALLVLSNFYHLEPPKIVVGTIKGKRKTAYAVYVQKEKKIYAMNSAIYYNPFVVLHEFYHHLRSRGGPHRGTEKYANAFAQGFIDSYKAVISRN